MNAEIEVFCEKQILPKSTRQKILLLVEEMLQLYYPYLQTTPLELTLAYSEQTESLQLLFETKGPAVDPFDEKQQPDQLSFSIINGLCESIESSRENDKTRITLRMKKG